MTKPLHPFLLFLLLLLLIPSAHVMSQAKTGTAVVDDEYERYKKRGNDLFKQGKYVESRQQYYNCLGVPGFENDTYAKGQIDECTTGLRLRQQFEEAIQKNNRAEAISLSNQLLNLNPDDAITKMQMGDYYEREGNKLFNQKRYTESLTNYKESLKYATATKRESLLIQIQTIIDILKPSKHIGMKLFTGAVAVGAGVYALLLRNDYQSKMGVLSQISQTTDPTNSGIVSTPDAYRQYDEAYRSAEAAQQKNGLFKACIGIAAVATIAEVYLLVHKPKPRTAGLYWKSSSQSVGLAIGYTF